ncbi:MAG: Fe-S cluster assembly protein SufD [Prevotella sp.]|nr:Fe-S cluster assembly protein SufD [Prevotella sp.]
MNAEQQYIDLYGQCRQLICDHSTAVMNAPRDEAYERFQTNGLPTRKVERYRYTNLQDLFGPDYGLNLHRYDIPVNPYQVFQCDVPNLSTALYFMVNDSFYEQSLPKNRLPEGVIVGSLSKHSERVSNYYHRLACRDEADGVTALNTMLAQDGLFVYVPKGVKVDKCLQVINILKAPSADHQGLMVNRRVLIVLEEGAELKMLFCDHAADDVAFLTTEVVEVFVDEGAHLDFYSLEESHYKNVRVSNVYVRQQRDSRFHHNVITLHNGTTRNMLNVSLAGEGAECRCNGCVIADKQQHVDNNTLIVHEVPHCSSRELYKYVLDDEAVGAFAGRVLVKPDAQQTASEMRNQNLCATRQTRMYTQPMLEIYADDVKCSHGSTVGQLNDAALFYMRQRGIPLKEARMLLQQAFVGEVISQIELPQLRDRLHYLVDKRFRGELNKCAGCKLCR